jgi:hypothetical protein
MGGVEELMTNREWFIVGCIGLFVSLIALALVW